MKEINIDLEPIMSQAAAAERAWRNGRIAERIIDHGRRADWREAELRIKLATMWAAVAGQFEFVTSAQADEFAELGDTDCLRLTERAEYCPAAGSPRCESCVWKPEGEVPNAAAETLVMPLPQRDPGATMLLPVHASLCWCERGDGTSGHIYRPTNGCP